MVKMAQGAILGAHSLRHTAHTGSHLLERLATHIITRLWLHPISDMAFESCHVGVFCGVVVESVYKETITAETAAITSCYRGVYPRDAVFSIQDQREDGSDVWTACH